MNGFSPSYPPQVIATSFPQSQPRGFPEESLKEYAPKGVFLRDAILHTLEFNVDSGDALVTSPEGRLAASLSLSGRPFVKYCKNCRQGRQIGLTQQAQHCMLNAVYVQFGLPRWFSG